MKIKNVLLCGLGAVGLTYANKLKDICSLKILADVSRIEKYKKQIPQFNGKKIKFDYITPEEKWTPDLIIIATKSNGLDSAIEYIKNYVNNNTIIISLINGISSENKIAEKYGFDKILYSYFIGHSAMREKNKVTQDGVGKIVFGSPYSYNTGKVKCLENFFRENHIDYEIPEDIIYSMWLKFTLNLFSNQGSAIMKLTFGEMKRDIFREFSKKIIKEVINIAEVEGIKNAKNLERDSINALLKMVDNGKTSMLQDILAKRKTEVDIFAGEIIKLGQKHNIPVPYNQVMYDIIKTMEGVNK